MICRIIYVDDAEMDEESKRALTKDVSLHLLQHDARYNYSIHSAFGVLQHVVQEGQTPPSRVDAETKSEEALFRTDENVPEYIQVCCLVVHPMGCFIVTNTLVFFVNGAGLV